MHRRQILSVITFGLCSLLWPFQRAWASVRRVLSADTDLSTLSYEDPARIDARLLPVTPVEQFGVSGTDDHDVDLNQWRLEISGLIQQPHAFDYTTLLQRPHFEKKVLLICPGTFAYMARWRGFSLARLLEPLGVEPSATHVDILGPPGSDQKIERFSLDEIRQEQVFLATSVNGIPLPQKHGFPLRVVADGHIGAEWVKYVYGVHLVHSDEVAPSPQKTEGAAFLP